jgi:hypothetical protein
MVESSRGASCCWRREERERSTQSVKRKGDGKGGKRVWNESVEDTGGVVEKCSGVSGKRGKQERVLGWSFHGESR